MNTKNDPMVCSMNFRYLMPTVVIGALFLGFTLSGSEKNSKLIVGYVIEFRDNDAKERKFSHRRIAIKPLFTYGGMSQIAAHPFVVPTVAAVQKKLNKPSTARPILKGEL